MISKLFSVTLLFLCFNSYSQSPKEIERDLHKSYSKLGSFINKSSDSLEKYSDLFGKKINNQIAKNLSTLSYPFKMLMDSNDCNIATSADGLFRIYSWDTWTGGTMHFFNNMYQYKSGDKIYSKPFELKDGDASCFYSEIYTLKVNAKTYYLGINNAIYSTKDISQSIKLFTIENNLLNDTTKLIKTQKGLTNEINVGYDFFSVVDRPERPIKLIKYDSDKKTIYIPVVYENGKVTNKFIVYQFNGQYFEHVVTPEKKKK